ncbi:MAG: hypothetical protein KAS32_28810 [Candidatus Peribacteraceae bacterium]|nr:hypothetical protein [Candidatus Peribacteraceae bacterium]
MNTDIIYTSSIGHLNDVLSNFGKKYDIRFTSLPICLHEDKEVQCVTRGEEIENFEEEWIESLGRLLEEYNDKIIYLFAVNNTQISKNRTLIKHRIGMVDKS